MEREFTKYEMAKKRVGQIKKFYRHVTIFIIVNIVLIVLKLKIVNYLLDQNGDMGPNFEHWVDWEIISTPVIWGLILLVHGIWVFYWPFTQKWEQRQIQKFMEKEEENHKRYR